jgi:hypothetical protein
VLPYVQRGAEFDRAADIANVATVFFFSASMSSGEEATPGL